MKRSYLYEYLKDSSRIDPSILDLMKCDLDQHIYQYGNHFRYPRENGGDERLIRSLLKGASILYKHIIAKKVDVTKSNVVSNAYFNFNAELASLGYEVYPPSWIIRRNDHKILNDYRTYRQARGIRKKLVKGDFNELLEEPFIKAIGDFIERSKDSYIKHNIRALVLASDMNFMSKLTINIFKELDRPSFIFLHGLPGRYNNIDENRADYLIVWGDRIKEQYVKAGVDGNKIFVSGHPRYKEACRHEPKFGLDNILVITKSISGIQHGDKVILADRGNLLLYLSSVQNVLHQCGVERVRFRPHPSESGIWYTKYLDRDFFHLDTDDIDRSLKNSTLVIGPTSTVLLESMFAGVNYVIYEPIINELDTVNYKPVPPFDGSDSGIPVAKNEADLRHILKTRTKVDPAAITDYVKAPFDSTFMKDII